jgi:hypothetical protein
VIHARNVPLGSASRLLACECLPRHRSAAKRAAEERLQQNHDETLAIVEEFVHDGTLTTKWGKGTQTRQAYELRIYETANRYDKRTGGHSPTL